MSCCHRTKGLPNIDANTALTLVKPFSGILNTEDLMNSELWLRIMLIDLGYAEIENNV
jgi:hypothetical protein